MGGGKPFGFGSCRASIEDLQVWTAASRYGDALPVQATPDAYLQAFTDSVPAEVTATWPALRAVLADNTVDPKLVWYPPGEHWSDQTSKDPRTAQRFDEPFAFFVGTSGMFLERGAQRSLRPLPEPTDPDQHMEIIRKSDLGKGTGGYQR